MKFWEKVGKKLQKGVVLSVVASFFAVGNVMASGMPNFSTSLSEITASAFGKDSAISQFFGKTGSVINSLGNLNPFMPRENSLFANAIDVSTRMNPSGANVLPSQCSKSSSIQGDMLIFAGAGVDISYNHVLSGTTCTVTVAITPDDNRATANQTSYFAAANRNPNFEPYKIDPTTGAGYPDDQQAMSFRTARYDKIPMGMLIVNGGDGGSNQIDSAGNVYVGGSGGRYTNIALGALTFNMSMQKKAVQQCSVDPLGQGVFYDMIFDVGTGGTQNTLGGYSGFRNCIWAESNKQSLGDYGIAGVDNYLQEPNSTNHGKSLNVREKLGSWLLYNHTNYRAGGSGALSQYSFDQYRNPGAAQVVTVDATSGTEGSSTCGPVSETEPDGPSYKLYNGTSALAKRVQIGDDGICRARRWVDAGLGDALAKFNPQTTPGIPGTGGTWVSYDSDGKSGLINNADDNINRRDVWSSTNYDNSLYNTYYPQGASGGSDGCHNGQSATYDITKWTISGGQGGGGSSGTACSGGSGMVMLKYQYTVKAEQTLLEFTDPTQDLDDDNFTISADPSQTLEKVDDGPETSLFDVTEGAKPTLPANREFAVENLDNTPKGGTITTLPVTISGVDKILKNVDDHLEQSKENIEDGCRSVQTQFYLGRDYGPNSPANCQSVLEDWIQKYGTSTSILYPNSSICSNLNYSMYYSGCFAADGWHPLYADDSYTKGSQTYSWAAYNLLTLNDGSFDFGGGNTLDLMRSGAIKILYETKDWATTGNYRICAAVNIKDATCTSATDDVSMLGGIIGFNSNVNIDSNAETLPNPSFDITIKNNLSAPKHIVGSVNISFNRYSFDLDYLTFYTKIRSGITDTTGADGVYSFDDGGCPLDSSYARTQRCSVYFSSASDLPEINSGAFYDKYDLSMSSIDYSPIYKAYGVYATAVTSKQASQALVYSSDSPQFCSFNQNIPGSDSLNPTGKFTITSAGECVVRVTRPADTTYFETFSTITINTAKLTFNAGPNIGGTGGGYWLQGNTGGVGVRQKIKYSILDTNVGSNLAYNPEPKRLAPRTNTADFGAPDPDGTTYLTRPMYTFTGWHYNDSDCQKTGAKEVNIPERLGSNDTAAETQIIGGVPGSHPSNNWQYYACWTLNDPGEITVDSFVSSSAGDTALLSFHGGLSTGNYALTTVSSVANDFSPEGGYCDFSAGGTTTTSLTIDNTPGKEATDEHTALVYLNNTTSLVNNGADSKCAIQIYKESDNTNYTFTDKNYKVSYAISKVQFDPCPFDTTAEQRDCGLVPGLTPDGSIENDDIISHFTVQGSQVQIPTTSQAYYLADKYNFYGWSRNIDSKTGLNSCAAPLPESVSISDMMSEGIILNSTPNNPKMTGALSDPTTLFQGCWGQKGSYKYIYQVRTNSDDDNPEWMTTSNDDDAEYNDGEIGDGSYSHPYVTNIVQMGNGMKTLEPNDFTVSDPTRNILSESSVVNLYTALTQIPTKLDAHQNTVASCDTTENNAAATSQIGWLNPGAMYPGGYASVYANVIAEDGTCAVWEIRLDRTGDQQDPLTITDPTPDNTGVGGVFYVLPGGGSGGQYTLTSSSPNVCSVPAASRNPSAGKEVADTEIDIIANGTCQLTLNRAATINYDPAVQVTIPFEIYSVSFSANGVNGDAIISEGVDSITKYTIAGGEVAAPVMPTRSGYDFVGWCKYIPDSLDAEGEPEPGQSCSTIYIAGTSNQSISASSMTGDIEGNTTYLARWSDATAPNAIEKVDVTIPDSNTDIANLRWTKPATEAADQTQQKDFRYYIAIKSGKAMSACSQGIAAQGDLVLDWMTADQIAEAKGIGIDDDGPTFTIARNLAAQNYKNNIPTQYYAICVEDEMGNQSAAYLGKYQPVTLNYDGNGNSGGSAPVSTQYFIQDAIYTTDQNTNNYFRHNWEYSGWSTSKETGDANIKSQTALTACPAQSYNDTSKTGSKNTLTDITMSSDQILYACWLDTTAPTLPHKSSDGVNIDDTNGTAQINWVIDDSKAKTNTDSQISVIMSIPGVDASGNISNLAASDLIDPTATLKYSWSCDGRSFSAFIENMTSYKCTFKMVNPSKVVVKVKDQAGNQASGTYTLRKTYYSITYNGNGGYPTTAYQYVDELNNGFQILSDPPKRGGYMFTGWCQGDDDGCTPQTETNKGQDGVALKAGDLWTTKVTQKIALTASWVSSITEGDYKVGDAITLGGLTWNIVGSNMNGNAIGGCGTQAGVSGNSPLGCPDGSFYLLLANNQTNTNMMKSFGAGVDESTGYYDYAAENSQNNDYKDSAAESTLQKKFIAWSTENFEGRADIINRRLQQGATNTAIGDNCTSADCSLSNADSDSEKTESLGWWAPSFDEVDQIINISTLGKNYASYPTNWWLRSPGSTDQEVKGVKAESGDTTAEAIFDLSITDKQTTLRPGMYVSATASAFKKKPVTELEVGSCEGTQSSGTATNDAGCVKFGDYSFDVVGLNKYDDLKASADPSYTGDKSGLCSMTDTSGYGEEECPLQNLGQNNKEGVALLLLSNNSAKKFGTTTYNCSYYQDSGASSTGQGNGGAVYNPAASDSGGYHNCEESVDTGGPGDPNLYYSMSLAWQKAQSALQDNSGTTLQNVAIARNISGSDNLSDSGVCSAADTSGCVNTNFDSTDSTVAQPEADEVTGTPANAFFPLSTKEACQLDSAACNTGSASVGSVLNFNTNIDSNGYGEIREANTDVENSNWWLRSVGANSNSPAYVGTNGQVVGNNAADNYSESFGIRPAILIKLSPPSGNTVQPASVSGSNFEVGTCGSSLAAAGNDLDSIYDSDKDGEPSCVKFGNYLFDVVGLNKRGATDFATDSGVTNLCAAGADSYDDDMNGLGDDGECGLNSAALMLSDKTDPSLISQTLTAQKYCDPYGDLVACDSDSEQYEYNLNYDHNVQGANYGDVNSPTSISQDVRDFWTSASQGTLTVGDMQTSNSLSTYVIPRNLTVPENAHSAADPNWSGTNCNSGEVKGCLGYTLSNFTRAIQNQFVTFPSMEEAMATSSTWDLGDQWTRSPGTSNGSIAYVKSGLTGVDSASNYSTLAGADINDPNSLKYMRPLLFVRVSMTTFNHSRTLESIADQAVEPYAGQVGAGTEQAMNIINPECYGSNVDEKGNKLPNGSSGAQACKVFVQVPEAKAGVQYTDLNFGDQIGAWGQIYQDQEFIHQIDTQDLTKLVPTHVWVKSNSEDGESWYYDVTIERQGTNQSALYMDDGTPESDGLFKVKIGGGQGDGQYSLTSATPDICSVNSNSMVGVTGDDRLGSITDEDGEPETIDMYSESLEINVIGSGLCKLNLDKGKDVAAGFNPATTINNVYQILDIHFQGQTSETYPEPTDLGPEGESKYILSGGSSTLLEKPTWDDHVFLGWCSGDNDTCSGNALLQPGQSTGVLSANTTYTAKWRPRGHNSSLLAINTGQEIDGILPEAKTSIPKDFDHTGDGLQSGVPFEAKVTFANDKPDIQAEDLQFSDYSTACAMPGGTAANPISPSLLNCEPVDSNFDYNIPITTSFGDPNVIYFRITAEAGEISYYKVTIYRIGKEQTTPIEFGPEALGADNVSEDKSGIFRILGVKGGNGLDSTHGAILVYSKTPTVCSVGTVTGDSEDGFVDAGKEYAADGSQTINVSLSGIGTCTVTAKRDGYQDVTNVDDSSLNQSFEASDYFADNTATESFDVYQLDVELNGGLYLNQAGEQDQTYIRYVLSGGTISMPKVGSVTKTGYDLMAYCYGDTANCNTTVPSSEDNKYFKDTQELVGPLDGETGSQTYTVRWAANGKTLVSLADQDINPEAIDLSKNPSCTTGTNTNQGSENCPIYANVTVPNDKTSINTIARGGDMQWGTQLNTSGKICKLAWSIANCGDSAPATNFYDETESIPLKVRQDATLVIQTTSQSGEHWYYIVKVDRLGKQQTTPISWGDETVDGVSKFKISRIYGGDGTGDYQVTSATKHVCELTDANSAGVLNVAANTSISVTMLQQGTCRLMGLRLGDDTYDDMKLAQKSPDYIVVQVNFDASPGVLVKGQAETIVTVLVALIGGSGVAPDLIPYRAGYTFAGWCYPNITNCVTQVAPGETTGILTDSLTTYHAKWSLAAVDPDDPDSGNLNSNAQLAKVKGTSVSASNATTAGAGKSASTPLLISTSVPNSVTSLTDLPCTFGTSPDVNAELACGDFEVSRYSIGATAHLMESDFTTQVASDTVQLGVGGTTTDIYLAVIAADGLTYNYYKISVYRENVAQADLTMTLAGQELDLTNQDDQAVEGRVVATIGGGSGTGAYSLTVLTPQVCSIADGTGYTWTIDSSTNEPIATTTSGTVQNNSINLITLGEGRCSVSLEKAGSTVGTTTYEKISYVNSNPLDEDGLNAATMLTIHLYSVLFNFGYSQNAGNYGSSEATELQKYIASGTKQKLPGTGSGSDGTLVRNGYDPANSPDSWCDNTSGSVTTCNQGSKSGDELTITANTQWIYTWVLHQSASGLQIGNEITFGGLNFNVIGYNDGTTQIGTCQNINSQPNCAENIAMLLLNSDSTAAFSALSSASDSSDKVLNAKFGSSTTYGGSNLQKILNSKVAAWEKVSFKNVRDIVPRNLTDIDGQAENNQIWWPLSSQEANLMSLNTSLSDLLAYTSSSWWARNKGTSANSITGVSGQNISNSGFSISNTAVGLRPALFVKLDSLLLDPNKDLSGADSKDNTLVAVNDGVQDNAVAVTGGDGKSAATAFTTTPITIDPNKTEITWQDLVLNSSSRATPYLSPLCSATWTNCGAEGPAKTINGSIYIQVEVISEAGVSAFYNLTITKAGNTQKTPIKFGEISNETTAGLQGYDQYSYYGISGGDSTGDYNLKIDSSSTDYCELVDNSGTVFDNTSGQTITPAAAATTKIHVRLLDSNLAQTSCKVDVVRKGDVNFADSPISSDSQAIYWVKADGKGGSWTINDVKSTVSRRYSRLGDFTYLPSTPKAPSASSFLGFCLEGQVCSDNVGATLPDGTAEPQYAQGGSPTATITGPLVYDAWWKDTGKPNNIPNVSYDVDPENGKITLTVTKTTDAISAKDNIKYWMSWGYSEIDSCGSAPDDGGAELTQDWELEGTGDIFTKSYQPNYNQSNHTYFIVCAEDDNVPPNAQTGVDDGGWSDDIQVNKLTYDVNGGEGGPKVKAQYAPVGLATGIPVSNELPTKQDWTFAGWSTENTTGNKSILSEVEATSCPGATYTVGSGTISIAGDTTLYACWLDKTQPTLSGSMKILTPVVDGKLQVDSATSPSLEIEADVNTDDAIASEDWQAEMQYNFSCDNGVSWTGYATDSDGVISSYCGIEPGKSITVLVRTMDPAGNISDTTLSQDFNVYSVSFVLGQGQWTNDVNSEEVSIVLPGATIDSSVEPVYSRHLFQYWCQDTTTCSGLKLNAVDGHLADSEGGDSSLGTQVQNIQGNMTFVANWIDKDYLMELKYIKTMDYGYIGCQTNGTDNCIRTTPQGEGVGESVSEPIQGTMTVPNGVKEIVTSDLVMNITDNGSKAEICGDIGYCGGDTTDDINPESSLSTNGREYGVVENPKYAGKDCTADDSGSQTTSDCNVDDFTTVSSTAPYLYIRTTSPDGQDHMFYKVTISQDAVNQAALSFGSPTDMVQSTATTPGGFTLPFSGGSASIEQYHSQAQPVKQSGDESVPNIIDHVNQYYLSVSTAAGENTSGCAITSLDNSSAAKSQGSATMTYKTAGTCTLVLGRYASLTYNKATELKRSVSIWTVTFNANQNTKGDFGYWSGMKKTLSYYVADGGSIAMPTAQPSWSNTDDTATFHGYCVYKDSMGALNTDNAAVRCDNALQAGSKYMPVKGNTTIFAYWTVAHIDISAISCSKSNTVYISLITQADGSIKATRNVLNNWTPIVKPANASNQKMNFTQSTLSKAKYLTVTSNATTNEYRSSTFSPLRTGLVKLTINPTDKIHNTNTKIKINCNINVDLTKVNSTSYKKFKDVTGPNAKTFGANIQWLLNHNITTGTTAKTYGPAQIVRRDQMAAFMYRLAGLPTYKLTGTALAAEKKIKDMPVNPTFSTAIKWMFQEGITTGTSDTNYSPGNPVTRAQMALFLWRLAGQPTISSAVQKKWKKAFKDLNIGSLTDSFRYAIYWLAETGITKGTTKTTYDPSGGVRRDQMAAFLNRFHDNYLMKTPI